MLDVKSSVKLTNIAYKTRLMIESMSTTPGIGDGAPRPAPQEATRPPMAPSMPKAPDASVIAADNSLAAEITTDLTAVPPRLDAALADAAGLPTPTEAQEPKLQGLTPEEMRSFGTKAERFIEEHPNEIVNSQEVPYDPYMLTDARRSVDPQIGQRFDAHGIDTLSADGIQRLNDLLVNGIDPDRPFFTAQLSSEPNSGAVSPRDTGSFILIGKPDQQIKDGGIGGVIVHEAYYDAIPRLQEAFPDIKFIKASEANNSLTEMASSAKPPTEASIPTPNPTQTSEPSETITPEAAAVSDAGQAEQPTTEPAPPPTEATPPVEDGDVDEELVREIMEATEQADGGTPLFSFIASAKAELDELIAGKASDERIYKAQLALESAANNEAGLLSSAIVIQAKDSFNAVHDTPQALAEAGQALKTTLTERDKTYKEIFARAKTRAKKSKTEYTSVLRDMTDSAKEIRDEAKAEYRKHSDEGASAETIKTARLRYEAAKMHYNLINKEKRKRILLDFLKIALLSSVITTTSQTSKTVKESTMEGVSPRR